jgi:hypothetical protein
MPIDVQCPCGRKSSVPDQHAGKKAVSNAHGGRNYFGARPTAKSADFGEVARVGIAWNWSGSGF